MSAAGSSCGRWPPPGRWTLSPPGASIGTRALSERSGTKPAGLEFRGFGWRPIGRRRTVVEDIDLRIDPGERVLLAGPSGAGKSTLLRAAAGILESAGGGEQFGEVRVDGRAGLLLQNPGDAVVADRVGRDVAFGPENAGVDRAGIWHRVHEALELVGFPYDVSTPTRSLSGGETQRLALAGALALRPGLLLLDEPTSMLDDEAAEQVRDAVLAVADATGATLVVAGHRMGAWLDHVDRLVVLGGDGRLRCAGEPAAVLGERSEELAAAGLWLPGLPPPEPRPVPLGQPSFPPRLRVFDTSDGEDAQSRREGLSKTRNLGARGVVLVEARDLTVRLRRRGLSGTRSVEAVAGVDATLAAGSALALTGRSGAGKSTLLAALGGLVRPTRGQVLAPALAAGLDPWPGRWRSGELAGRVGWVPQDPEHGFVTQRVADEVGVTAARLGRTADTDALLAAFGLDRLADASPYHLSGGEQRRLVLLAGLAHAPPLALLDEPTVGQDRHTWGAIAGIVRSLVNVGSGVAIATHDRALVDLVDSEIVLDRGRIVERS